MGTMTRRTVFVALLAFGLAGCGTAATQLDDTPELRQEKARAIAKLEIANGDLDERLDRGAELAYASSLDTLKLELGRELNAQEETRVKAIMRNVLGEFLTEELWEGLLTETYAEHFTATELQSILAFFQAPAGKKILELSGMLAAEIDEKTDARLEGRLDEFVARIDDELGKEFPELRPGEE